MTRTCRRCNNSSTETPFVSGRNECKRCRADRQKVANKKLYNKYKETNTNRTSYPITKCCGRCGDSKSSGAFQLCCRTKDGLSPYCSTCTHDIKSPAYRRYYRRHQGTIRAKARTKASRTKHTAQHKYNRYKSDSKRRQREFTLTYEQFNTIISQNCYYCGSNSSIGIDRCNSKLGYIINNCVPCCTVCNIMKGKMTKLDFIEQAKRISKHANNVV